MIKDPFVVLGVPEDAAADAIQRAYLAAVRAHPPERDPEGFQAIRTAYECLKDPTARRRFQWLNLEGPDLAFLVERALETRGRPSAVKLKVLAAALDD
ncbi:MAG: DnaJ domain-containing protein [Candidatus Competibacterales bacterium]